MPATAKSPPNNAAPEPAPAFKAAQKESVRKFGAAVAARFTIVPALLFEKQRELKIEPIELAVLLQLMSFWWRADALPWPSKQKLGDRLGMDPSNVRRHITRLCEKGIIERVKRTDKVTKRQESNLYSFKPLVRKLKKLAEAAQKKKDQKAAAGDPK